MEQRTRDIVTSRLTGNFPGSPVDLRFAFRLERGKIASLKSRHDLRYPRWEFPNDEGVFLQLCQV